MARAPLFAKGETRVGMAREVPRLAETAAEAKADRGATAAGPAPPFGDAPGTSLACRLAVSRLREIVALTGLDRVAPTRGERQSCVDAARAALEAVRSLETERKAMAQTATAMRQRMEAAEAEARRVRASGAGVLDLVRRFVRESPRPDVGEIDKVAEALAGALAGAGKQGGGT